jgi:hypothetical protein
MSEVLAWMGEHPILTLFLASMTLGAIVKIIPWSRGD